MKKQLADIRKTIEKDGPKTDLQARKLARVAATIISPDAVKLENELTEKLRAIPLAEQLRGQSDAARQEALDTLDKIEKRKR